MFSLFCINSKDLLQSAMVTVPEGHSKFNKVELIACAKRAIETLDERDEEITGGAVAAIVGIPRSTLISHDEIAEMISFAEAKRLERAETVLVARAETLLRDQYPSKQHCSQEALAQQLHISRSKLRRTKGIMKLLEDRI